MFAQVNNTFYILLRITRQEVLYLDTIHFGTPSRHKKNWASCSEIVFKPKKYGEIHHNIINKKASRLKAQDHKLDFRNPEF